VAEAVEFLDITWPLLVIRFPREMSPVAMKATIEGFERLYDRKERHVVLADCSPVVKFPGTFERKMLSEWLSAPGRVEKEKRYTAGTGVVLTSGPMRAMMAAIMWVSPPVTPQIWKATVPDAFEWCYQRLVEAGLPITEAIEAARAEHKRLRPASQPAR
jgi:hypothetical protein